MTLNAYGNFSLAREELKKVGLKALYKLRKEMSDNFRENIIRKDSAELVQIKFLKWLLGVNKYHSNIACRAETGRFPMKSKHNIGILSSG